MADSARWERFEFRDGDVVISTPSKCGTTWMQHIVGTLLLDRTELGVPVSQISPWLDMLTHTDAQVFGLLAAQQHRRFIKTHTPLDGVPTHPDVTYVSVARHPLDVALSDRDHSANQISERALQLRRAASGPLDRSVGATWSRPPDDAAGHLRWFIDNDRPPTGSGPNGLDDFCQQVAASWERRHQPNVYLVHYTDLWSDLDGEMRRIARALDVDIDEARWPDFVDAATLGSMRSRADDTAPDAHLDMWHDASKFFRVGGTREWASLLDEAELAHFNERLHTLAGDAAPWIITGRAALT